MLTSSSSIALLLILLGKYNPVPFKLGLVPHASAFSSANLLFNHAAHLGASVKSEEVDTSC
jgi:hypothetical protein